MKGSSNHTFLPIALMYRFITPISEKARNRGRAVLEVGVIQIVMTFYVKSNTLFESKCQAKLQN